MTESRKLSLRFVAPLNGFFQLTRSFSGSTFIYSALDLRRRRVVLGGRELCKMEQQTSRVATTSSTNTSSSLKSSKVFSSLLEGKKEVRRRMAILREKKKVVVNEMLAHQSQRAAVVTRTAVLRSKHDELATQVKTNEAVCHHLETKLAALKEREKHVLARRHSLMDAMKAVEKRRDNVLRNVFKQGDEQMIQCAQHAQFCLESIAAKEAENNDHERNRDHVQDDQRRADKEQELGKLKEKLDEVDVECDEMQDKLDDQTRKKKEVSEQHRDLNERYEQMEERLKARREKLYFGGLKRFNKE